MLREEEKKRRRNIPRQKRPRDQSGVDASLTENVVLIVASQHMAAVDASRDNQAPALLVERERIRSLEERVQTLEVENAVLREAFNAQVATNADLNARLRRCTDDRRCT